MAVQGVLLDLDGTLVLSNDIHAESWAEAFAAFGYGVSFDQVRPLIGMGADQLIPKIIPELDGQSGEGKEIADHRKSLILEKYIRQIQAAPGSRELVQRLSAVGLKLVIASSASQEESAQLQKIAQIDDLIEQETTSADADASKPEPDIVQAALEKGGLQASETLMLGDTPYDIESAGKAGVSVIALRCGGFPDEQLQGAIAIYDNPADLLRHFDDSPLAPQPALR